MSHIHRRTFLIGASTLLASPYVMRGQSRAATRLNLGWDRAFAPAAIIPKAAEFALADSGVSIEMTSFGRGLDGMIALQKGDIQAASILVNFFHLCMGLSRDIDLTVVSGAAHRLISLLVSPSIVPADQIDAENMACIGDKPWELLRGKRVGTARGSQPEFALRLYLQANGLDPQRDIEFVDLKSNADQALALQQGSIDAAAIIEPVATRARLEGYALLLAHPWRTVDFVKLNSPLMVRTGLIKDDPDLVQALVDAHVKSIDYYSGDPATWTTDTAATTLIDKNVLDHVMNPAALGLDPQFWHNIEVSYQMPLASILELARISFENGLVEKDVSDLVAQRIDYSFLEKATGKSRQELGG